MRKFSALLIVTFVIFSLPLIAKAGSLSKQERAQIAGTGIVGSEVSDVLDLGQSARVIIIFDVSGAASGASAVKLNSPAMRAEVQSVGQAILREMAFGEFNLIRQYQSVNALAGEITMGGLMRLLKNPKVLRIDIDEPVQGNLNYSVPLMQLDTLHIQGYNGTGVTVAVLDSGIDTNHPDLAANLVAEQCFCAVGTGCCPGGGTTQSGAGAAEDDNGHGTHVSGIIASKGFVSSVGGAPNAGIVAVKVLNSAGSGYTSDIVYGLDWIINNRPDVEAINISIGSNTLFSGDCDNAAAWTQALAIPINTLWANNVPVFVSAGNNCSSTQMTAPACIAKAFSVGATWSHNAGGWGFSCCVDATTSTDKVACFSNSNSSMDMFAPGAPIVSDKMGGGTIQEFGTSMASPSAASCAAALLQKYHGLPMDAMELVLESSSVHITDARNGLTFPRVACLDSFNACAADSDGDGFGYCDERIVGTNPTLIDTDGDSINDYDDYLNPTTDPLVQDLVCRGGSIDFGLYCWADTDGNGSPTGVDSVNMYSFILSKVSEFPAVYPKNGNTADLNGDGGVTGQDLVVLSNWLLSKPAAGEPPTSIVRIDPATNPTVAVGNLQVINVKVRDSLGTAMAGVGAVFTISGNGQLIGGRGSAAGLTNPEGGVYPTGSRWDITGTIAGGGLATMYVKVTGSEPITVNVSVSRNTAKQLGAAVNMPGSIIINP